MKLEDMEAQEILERARAGDRKARAYIVAACKTPVGERTALQQRVTEHLSRGE